MISIWPYSPWFWKNFVILIADPVTRGPIYYHGLTLIPALMSTYIDHIAWDEITYPFPKFNGEALSLEMDK